MNIFFIVYLLLCFFYWYFAGSEEIEDEQLNGFLKGSYFFVIFSFMFGISGLFSQRIIETFPYFLGTFFWLFIWKINLDEIKRRIILKSQEEQETGNTKREEKKDTSKEE